MTTLQTGCYIGSSHGIYSIEMLYNLAVDLNPDAVPADAGVIIHHSLHGEMDTTVTLPDGTEISFTDANDIVGGELYDELTDLLPVEDGYVWTWVDGELFYADLSELDTDGEWT
ncbi:MAG: hypothetical protein QGD93_10845 [Actinomycetota bacterium]|nr:hypothetical protein [Actinomycetota bacterium]